MTKTEIETLDPRTVRERVAVAVAEAHALPRVYGKGREALKMERARRAWAFLESLSKQGQRSLPAWVGAEFVGGVFRTGKPLAQEMVDAVKEQPIGRAWPSVEDIAERQR